MREANLCIGPPLFLVVQDNDGCKTCGSNEETQQHHKPLSIPAFGHDKLCAR
jgi:hypothetical protein